MLSLDPKTNPLIRLYELFDVPGVKTEDNPNYLRVTVPLKWAQPGDAYDLVRFLSGLPSGVLSELTLKFGGRQLADFTGPADLGWFERDTIEDLVAAGKLCDLCAAAFENLHARFDEYQLGADWPTIEDDSRQILNDLETCSTCGPGMTVEAAIDKTSATKEFLIDDLLASEKNVSALVWSDPDHMIQSFENFQEFLEFIKGKVDGPLVIFFHQPIEPYQGDYFKTLALSRVGVPTSDMEEELVQNLAGFSTDVVNRYKMLRLDHREEKRAALGERFDIPPTLFLRQTGQLASYPSHPIFQLGPLRSLLIYAMMAWLAQQTDGGDVTVFTLSEDNESPLRVSLRFGLSDVYQDEQSIFGDDKWSEIAGLVARDIGQSAGSENLRDCWTQTLVGMTTDDFDAQRFFTTLEVIRQGADKRRREPPKDIRNLTPDLFLYIYLDTSNKKIFFQLAYYNPQLGLGLLPTSLSSPLPEVSISELDEMAKRHLVSLLDSDPNNRDVKIPKMRRLVTRGEALWEKMIPFELKQAIVSLAPDKDLTLFIFSEDRAFPWELIKPRELVGSKVVAAGFEGDWWALRFGIARWAPGAPPPANELGITRVCCVAASSQLSSAEKEVEYFESLRPQGVEVDRPGSADELLEFLETRKYDVIHFACHGEFKEQDPGESAMQMPDGGLLQPDDLREGNINQRIRDNRPLIFLNCCHSGRTGSTLVGIAGWAKYLVDWGCGAFIGCGWEVADPLAAEFAVTFYKGFRDTKNKKSLGQAVHEARRQIKDRSLKEGRPENSTWLAYYLYGNPNCRYKEELR